MLHGTSLRLSAGALALSATLLIPALSRAQAQTQTQAPHQLTAAEQQKVDALVQRMTVEEKLDYIGGTGFAIRAVPSVGLPALEMSDGPYGTRSNAGLPSTTYAAGIGLAAAWDRDLAAKEGAAIGRDARARGVHFMLGPGVNIYRSPHNGRNFEYYGEDPYLAGEMAVGYITGMQTQGVSATVKHFLANNSEFLRHDSDSVIDERALREIYLPAFEAAVKRGHVGAIMDSYNLINGAHATQNGYFNTQIVRKEWGFPGIMMSDWVATYDAVGAANNGLDLEMPTGRFMNRANLQPALSSGTVQQSTIDEKVRRILTTAQSFGWLDNGHQQRDGSIPLDDTQNNAVALRTARESITLLKNQGNLLPLPKTAGKTILVVGPDAYPGVPVGGGSAGVVPFRMTGPMEGIQELAGGFGATVTYDEGVIALQQLARETHFMTAATGGQPGLISETFQNGNLSGAGTQGLLRSINSGGGDRYAGNEALDGTPLDTSTPNTPGRARELQQPRSHRITGYYNVEAAGPYLLAVSGSGEGTGSRVYVDGKLVLDSWHVLRAFEPHITLPLSAGMHKVVVESWQGDSYGDRLRVAMLPEDKAVSETAKALAAKADYVVISAGFQTGRQIESEGEGGDRTWELPYGQDALIRAMLAANPHTIVALTSGGNVNSTQWIDRTPALLETWYGGQSAGRALAEVLFGDVNPSGHLPATFERRAEDNPTYANYYPADAEFDKYDPKDMHHYENGKAPRVVYKEGIFVGYRGYQHNRTTPLFPFGFGLSYTTFRFGKLTVAPSGGGPQMTASFDVTNTGSRPGAQVAQVYVGDPHSKVARPIRELKGFERVELAPGETKHVTVPLDARAFAYYDVPGKKWAIEPGKFTVEVGDSVDSLPLKETVSISKEAAATASF